MRHLAPATALLMLASCGNPPPDPRGVDRGETLLSLSATGEAETIPDEAGIEIGIETFAPTAQAASAAVAKKGEAIAAALSKFGVAAKDLQTRNLSVGRVTYGPRKGQFQANNILAVRLRDVGKAGEALAAATDAGANVLSGPSLHIADPEKANRGAYIAAYRAARTRAEAYAEAAGMEIARVLAIRDGGQGGGMPMPQPVDYKEEADASSAVAQNVSAPSIRPGSNRVRVAVQVDFALEPK